jgi:hypothetical protein
MAVTTLRPATSKGQFLKTLKEGTWTIRKALGILEDAIDRI